MQTGQWGRRGWCDGEGGFITTHIEDECGNNIPQFDVCFEIEKSSNKKTANCQEKDDRWRKIQIELKIHLMSSDLPDERAQTRGHTHTYTFMLPTGDYNPSLAKSGLKDLVIYEMQSKHSLRDMIFFFLSFSFCQQFAKMGEKKQTKKN